MMILSDLGMSISWLYVFQYRHDPLHFELCILLLWIIYFNLSVYLQLGLYISVVKKNDAAFLKADLKILLISFNVVSLWYA